MRLLDSLLRLLTRRTNDPPRASAQSAEEAAEAEPFGEGQGDENPFPEPVRLEIRDVFDLHAIAPRDVRAVVEEYLYQARLAGYRSVRIIHGKGVGVQRELVRGILARTPFVTAFTDAPLDGGGWGATIAHLSASSERETEG